ncbi:MAG: two-component regulator propeller domain-containing protein [Candidatus Cloacimonadaceae bacterium]|jgi:ligand-binding sensor domain-containing protein|nr:T9SS type A sorting domain-containing protein [Candidatus Cloacimonadota bacterium]MDY0126995.1 two-component regulator propeller domain-containing protein [Candidatus Cloacimonadaceae bacterium]MCB5254807.1 T9SS type A sorting domain-containing protein [Candidatus Cloacimonadota bacterium]MCK9177806.1 T9SS type A sorting domain-containing protein [Candidatus Cloacimonadota bacterium]MCK9243299.1 T9SS type A sorting domain-containing protein [Candidatus Cloacimonadota bacterium]
MKRLLCFASMLFLLGMLSAQDNTWHVYRPGYQARDICSHNGELWVASYAGIMRWNPTTDQRIQYDESNTPYPNSYISCLCLGADGAMYAGGDHGLLRFGEGSWQLFNTNNSGLIHNVVRKIVADPNGGIWIATDMGLSFYRQRVWTSFNSTNSTLPDIYDFYDLCLDPARGLWIATTNTVHYYDGSEWTAYTSQNSTLPNYQVKSISFQANGDGWFGLSHGVARYSNRVWQRQTALDGVAIGEVTGSCTDPLQRVWLWNDSTLWLCTDEPLHYPIQTFGTHYMQFSRMMMDENQTIWLGFLDRQVPVSLIRFDGTDYSRHPVSEFPLASRNVQEVFRGFDDNIWIAACLEKGVGGYFCVGADGIQAFGRYNTDMPCFHVWSLAQDRLLNIWVGTCIGLLKTGPSGSELIAYNAPGLGGGYIETICPVGDGVWIGNNQGVSRYEDGIWTPISSAEAGLNLAYTKMIKTDRLGRVWIASSAGVCCYADDQFTAYPQITYASDITFGVDDEVWVARGELSRLQDGEWTHFNADNSGLPQNDVKCVAMDQNQLLWIGLGGSYHLLCSFDGETWSNFNPQNSPLTGWGITTIFVDEDNSKWLGGEYLFRYNEDGIPVSNADEIVPPSLGCVNYPNPFRTSTTIRIDKRTEGPLHIKIYNMKGQLVWNQSGIDSAKGEISWDGKDKHGQDCASGLYLIQVQDRGGSLIHKALKLK